MVSGRWKPNKNVALVSWARGLLKGVEESGRQIHWLHVKGHSADGGNDRADELVQWGKGKAPFCRLREGKEIEVGEGMRKCDDENTTLDPKMTQHQKEFVF